MDEEPYHSVRVGYTNSNYLNACEYYGGGYQLLPRWKALGNFLAGRTGWHFDVVNHGEALWSLGVMGESRLNIHVAEDGQYSCYDHITDVEAMVADIADIETWLDDREDRAKQPSDTAVSYASAMDWMVFKKHRTTLLVSWSDGYFSASLPHHLDSAFGDTLPEAVRGAAQMLCRLFNAPLELAPDLTLALELDETASRRLTSDGQ